MFVNQKNNNVSGDLVGGSKIEIHYDGANAVPEELIRLYEKLKVDGIGEPSGNSFSEKLNHYFSNSTSSDVRGLEEKLNASGRTDELAQAKILKERATKEIMKRQGSNTAQRVYTIVLDELFTTFSLTVRPVIQEGGSRTTVDRAINETINDTKRKLGENVLQIDASDLYGLLFFLGGNCHIRWDKC